MTPLENQLIEECEKLIGAIRALRTSTSATVLDTLRAANEVEDFIENNFGEEDAEETQRGEEGSPLAEIPPAGGAGQAQEGGEGGVSQARMSLELGSKLRETARHIVGQIDAFDKRCAANETTDTGEVWELLDDWRCLLKARLEGK